jgi:hypothetical protein
MLLNSFARMDIVNLECCGKMNGFCGSEIKNVPQGQMILLLLGTG